MALTERTIERLQIAAHLAAWLSLAVLILALVFVIARDNETRRLRAKHDAGMQQFWRVYSDLRSAASAATDEAQQ